MSTRMATLTVTGQLWRLLRCEDGDDLIEYALLTATIGMVGVAAFNFLHTAIGTVYVGWDTNVQSLWESPNP